MILALTVIFSLLVFSANATSDGEGVDILYDQSPLAKTEAVPSMHWEWSNGVYTGNCNIIQFTNTNYYFSGNSEGKIYYSITGTSDSDQECSVRTICRTCGEQIASYAFYPSSVSETPAYRVVTLGDHANHYVYFKIVAYDGGWFWSNNDFRGTLMVSDDHLLR